MEPTFRLRRSVQFQGIAFTFIYLAITVGVVTALLLIDDPKKQGFRDEQAVMYMVAMWIAVFGTMTLLSSYILLAYYVERFSIAGRTIRVRSVFQNRQFDPVEVDKLIWTATPRGGKVLFIVGGQKTRMHLHGFRREDRLEIIRLLRDLISVGKQDGWPLFCFKIAVPLRDGAPIQPTTADRVESQLPAGQILITRRRYDRLFALLIPASVAGVSILWRAGGVPQLFGLPVLLVAAWLLLRFNIPPNGRRQARVTATSQGRTMLFGYSAIVAAKLVSVVAYLAGSSREEACGLSLVILGPALPIIFYRLYRADKERNKLETLVAEAAPEKWRLGEQLQASPVDGGGNSIGLGLEKVGSVDGMPVPLLQSWPSADVATAPASR